MSGISVCGLRAAERGESSLQLTPPCPPRRADPPRSRRAVSMKRAHPEYSSSDSELDETIEVEKESADENG